MVFDNSQTRTAAAELLGSRLNDCWQCIGNSTWDDRGLLRLRHRILCRAGKRHEQPDNPKQKAETRLPPPVTSAQAHGPILDRCNFDTGGVR